VSMPTLGESPGATHRTAVADDGRRRCRCRSGRPVPETVTSEVIAPSTCRDADGDRRGAGVGVGVRRGQDERAGPGLGKRAAAGDIGANGDGVGALEDEAAVVGDGAAGEGRRRPPELPTCSVPLALMVRLARWAFAGEDDRFRC